MFSFKKAGNLSFKIFIKIIFIFLKHKKIRKKTYKQNTSIISVPRESLELEKNIYVYTFEKCIVQNCKH